MNFDSVENVRAAGFAGFKTASDLKKMTGGFEYKESIPTIWQWHEHRMGTGTT